jgi:hypothetical protein
MIENITLTLPQSRKPAMERELGLLDRTLAADEQAN